MLTFVHSSSLASEYAEIALGESAKETGLYICNFFLGSPVRPDWRAYARPDRCQASVVLGCALAASGSIVGRAAYPTACGFTDLVHHPAGRWDGSDAYPRQHRRRQPCDSPVLREATGITRRSGTTPPASAWPFWARFWSPSCARSDEVPGRQRIDRRTSRCRGPSYRGVAGRRGARSHPHFIRLDFAYATQSCSSSWRVSWPPLP